MATSTKTQTEIDANASDNAATVEHQSDNIAHALAGAGGGLLSMTLTYPLITLSTRAQVESKRAHTSTLNAVRHIVRKEGFSGLYSGLESALFGISVTNFIYYYWYEWTRSLFSRAALKSNRRSTNLTTVESMLAGLIAGSATVLLTNPIWVVNTRMTARKSDDSTTSKSKPSTLTTLRAILRDEGFSALFAGVLPALVLVINPILQYTIFEQLKNLLEARRRRNLASGSASALAAGAALVGPRDAFVLGAVGKLAATGITYPYITVKSRAHVAKKEKEADIEAGEKTLEGEGEKKKKARAGVLDGLRKVVREEGWGGLYGGVGPKLTQSVLTAAFLFAFKDVLYEATVKARRGVKKVAV